MKALRSGAGRVKHRRRLRRVWKMESETPPIVAEIRNRYLNRQMRRLGFEKMPLRFVKAPLPPTVTERNVNGHLLDIVRITDEMMQAGKELAEKILRHHSEAGWKETLEGRDIMWETAGILGELAAGEDLLGDWRKSKVLYSLETSPDGSDFDFQRWTLDVKTAGREFHRNLLVPVPKFEKRHPDIYIGAQLKTPREVWIWGYATRDEVASAPVKNLGLGASHCIPLSDLHPISGLRDYLSKEPSLLRYATCIMTSDRLEAIMRQFVKRDAIRLSQAGRGRRAHGRIQRPARRRNS